MRSKSWIFIFCASVFLFTQQAIHASQVAGGYISYTCNAPNSYTIGLTFYSDCSGVPINPVQHITISSASCGISFSTTLIQGIIPSVKEISPLCTTRLQHSACHGGTLIGYQEYFFSRIVVLPSQCNDWEITYSRCCRTNSLTNITPHSMSLKAHINNMPAISPCNSSPTYRGQPIIVACVGQEITLDHGIKEADGDSIAVKMMVPLNGSGVPLSYSAGYTAQNPIINTGGISFDSTTGLTVFTPTVPQVCAFLTKVEEYRNGNLIGYTMRETIIRVENCTNQLPDKGFLFSNLGGGQIVDSNSFTICYGDTIDIRFQFHDPDSANVLTAINSIKDYIPNATFNAKGGNPLTGRLRWVPKLQDLGKHWFAIGVSDNACPKYGLNYFPFDITVLPSLEIPHETILCTYTGPETIFAQGGENYSWAPASGIINAAPDSSWVEVFPTVTTTYTVFSSIANGCKNMDTIRVVRAPDFSYSLNYKDTICRNLSTQVLVSTDSSLGPYSYSWIPSEDVDSPTVQHPILSPKQTTTFHFEIESAAGCVLNDSITIHVEGISPIPLIKTDQAYLCNGGNDSTKLEVFIAPDECSINYYGCNTAQSEIIVGHPSGNTAWTTPFRADYKFSRMQILFEASELQLFGLEAGSISSIAFEVVNKFSTNPLEAYTVRMGCVDDLPSQEFADGLQKVFGPSNVTTSSGWNTLQFSKSYNWDGHSDLIVEICHTSSSFSYDDEVSGTYTANTSVLYKYGDIQGPGCSLDNPQSSNSRPLVRFGICWDRPSSLSLDLTWTPANGLSSATADETWLGQITSPVTYTVQIDSNGCIGLQSVYIDFDTASMMAAGDQTICEGDTIRLNAIASGIGANEKLDCGIYSGQILNPVDSMAINGGSLSFGGTPFQGLYEDMRYQILIKAWEIQLWESFSHIITKFGLEVAEKFSTADLKNLTISMGCTPALDLSTNSYESADHVVFSAQQYQTVQGWNTFDFTSPFSWDGQSNIVIEICWDNPDGVPLDATDNLMVHSTLFNSSSRKYGTGQSGCNTTSPPSVTYNKRPNLFLHMARSNYDFTYDWQVLSGDYFSILDSGIANPYVAPVISSSYEAVSTTALGCRIADTVDIEVHPIPIVNAGQDTTIHPGKEIQLFGTGGPPWRWTPVYGLDNPFSEHPFLTIYTTTTYTLTVTDTHGCRGFDTVRVEVKPIKGIYFPTAFSPNNDGVNDYYFPQNGGKIKLHFYKIYNRWGEVVFEANHVWHKWDGTHNGKPQEVGAYMYIFEGCDEAKNFIRKSGSLVLIR